MFEMDVYPVLGSDFCSADFCPIPLSKGHDALAQWDVTTYEGLDAYVQHVKKMHNAKVAFGGYGEHRAIYTDSAHFNNPAQNRCIHLGIDLWIEAETPVYAPLDGVIHSFRYNGNHLDYGATIITEHVVGGRQFWLLFGHLSLKSLEGLAKNAPILRGQRVAWLGNRDENGGWSPHLHLQMITDLMGWEGDFPGVATLADASKMLEICPSPAIFCGFDVGKPI